MPTTSSRYRRPEKPVSGLCLQKRDQALLVAIFQYRFTRADHLYQLLFHSVSRRVVQGRLRKLWEHRLIDRYFIPFVVGGAGPGARGASEPIYALAPSGASIVAEALNIRLIDVPTPFRHHELMPMTLSHQLVVTDFLVALTVACRSSRAVTLVESTTETKLWRLLARADAEEGVRLGAIVPDGAFTLLDTRSGERLTWYIEVVRAAVKGGNERLAQKFERYLVLNRSGFFRRIYGHERLRAVLFLTTSNTRMEHFLRLAAGLTHGRRLFWFGVYEKKDADGRSVSTMTADSILSTSWQTPDGEAVSFLPAAPATPSVGV